MANNPAPIPGCHAPEGCCSQCCGPLDPAKLLTLKRVYCVKTVIHLNERLLRTTVIAVVI